MKEKRGQIPWDPTIFYFIAFAAIVLGVVLYFKLGGTLDNIGDFFKDWLRFGR